MSRLSEGLSDTSISCSHGNGQEEPKSENQNDTNVSIKIFRKVDPRVDVCKPRAIPPVPVQTQQFTNGNFSEISKNL